MGYGFQAHVLRRLCSEGRSHSACAEKDERLILTENRLVVRAFRIDPEFEHAARAMECAGNSAIPSQLTWIADVDQLYVRPLSQLDGLLDRILLDLSFRRFHQCLVSQRNFLRHLFSPSTCSSC